MDERQNIFKKNMKSGCLPIKHLNPDSLCFISCIKNTDVKATVLYIVSEDRMQRRRLGGKTLSLSECSCALQL